MAEKEAVRTALGLLGLLIVIALVTLLLSVRHHQTPKEALSTFRNKNSTSDPALVGKLTPHVDAYRFLDQNVGSLVYPEDGTSSLTPFPERQKASDPARRARELSDWFYVFPVATDRVELSNSIRTDDVVQCARLSRLRSVASRICANGVPSEEQANHCFSIFRFRMQSEAQGRSNNVLLFRKVGLYFSDTSMRPVQMAEVSDFAAELCASLQ